MQENQKLGKNFEGSLIYHLLYSDVGFAKEAIENISPSYFENENHQFLFVMIKNHYDNYNNTFPTLTNIKNEVKKLKNESQNKVLFAELLKLHNKNLAITNGTERNDFEYVKKETITYIKEQKLKLFAIKLQNNIDTSNLGDAFLNEFSEFHKELSILGDKEDYGSDVTVESEGIYSSVQRDPIPTGLKELDKVIEGLGRGKLGLILAPQGAGKSTALAVISANAYQIGKKVLHVIFDENEEEEIKRLIRAKWTKVPVKEFKLRKAEIKEISKKHIEQYNNKGGKLVIKRFASDGMTVPKLRKFIEKYQKHNGIKFDLVVVDYLDELEPVKVKASDVWNGQTEVVKSFRSLLVDLDIPGWSAVQTGKEGNTSTLLTPKDVGGSLSRFKKAQLVIGIARDMQMKKDDRANINIIKSNISGSGHVFNDCIFNNSIAEIILSAPEGGTSDINEDDDAKFEEIYTPPNTNNNENNVKNFMLESENIKQNNIELVKNIDFNL